MKVVGRSKRHMTRGDIKMVSKEIRSRMEDEDLEVAVDYSGRFEKLRSDSGNIGYSDNLTTFFYLLLRDHLPAGKVEMIVNEVIRGPEDCSFINGYLAQYADNLSKCLKDAKTKSLERALEAAFGGKIEKQKPPKTCNMLESDLAGVEEKINKAVENMSDEDKKEWEDKIKAIEDAEKVSGGNVVVIDSDREDLEELQNMIDEASDSMTKDERREWNVSISRLNLHLKDDDEEWVKKEVFRMKKNLEERKSDIEEINDRVKEEKRKCNGICENNDVCSENCKCDEETEERNGCECKEEQNDRPKKCGGDCKCKEDESAKTRCGGCKDHDNPGTEIVSLLANLDKLKELVPTDEVDQIIKILKSEVEDGLTDETKKEIQSRESILAKRAKENAEHKSSEENAEQKAVEFVKEKFSEKACHDYDDVMISRGSLNDVAKGVAFPEALEEIFDGAE